MVVGRELYWRSVGERRIGNILRNHDVARMRTLEQKICDAGPNDQRPNPHHLTEAKNNLTKSGELEVISGKNGPWFYLPDTPSKIIDRRLSEQRVIVQQLDSVYKRTGECLEVAVFKALEKQSELDFLGRFKLVQNNIYKKEELPSYSGNKKLSGNMRLDFTITFPVKAAIEVKNRREWIYPESTRLQELLLKATCIDYVPVLIARRIPYVTFMLLEQCGVVFHQTFNQLIDESDRAVAEKAKDKTLLGYHDIRIGHEPDKRLLKFVGTNLPKILPKAREKFDKHKTLLALYATGEFNYPALVKAIKTGEW